MTQAINLLMLSAMYENGGNTTHRFLDGHPQMFVYPFESQIGTNLVQDAMTSLFPVKYRFPVFAEHTTAEQDYFAIIDEEGKVRARTPHVSKFRHADIDMSDDERRDIFVNYINQWGKSTGNNVAAFFMATFDAWKNYKRTGGEVFYVGYSPIIAVDTQRIMDTLPNAHVLHVVRNPWSAFADTSKRPKPMSLHDYTRAWNLNQYYALYYQQKYPERFHLLRIEDIMADPQGVLGKLCEKLNLDSKANSLTYTSWNGEALTEVYPWGTLRRVRPEDNLATAQELSADKIAAIRDYTWQYLDTFDYKGFIK